ncbi:hypothetical protein HY68_28560 [Streptomyces sp. AcH 505]|uniref:MarR family winged helix-turn-helix transcriptional regulator n=1 Tax=unclassified Streptomyces TaxID=2593676 RepID=UPI0005919E90|nr:MarR family transcriptional regulator [Streptomyces sp. NBC_00370]KIF71619.1 hypothetical protein HY68_28560 [Streptomyces sp. AcH 505]
MTEAEKSAGESAAVRGTATRLRVSLGAFRRRVHEAATEGDLTGPELTAVSRLDRGGPSTIAELARREQISPQAMGATVAGLERRGLVVREPDANDGRRSILTLTPAGRTAIRSGRSAIVDKMVVALDESFTREEIAALDEAALLIERLADLL